MVTQVSTLVPTKSLSALGHEWRVLAFRPNGQGEWRWYITPLERDTLQKMITDKTIITAHRRDGDGTRLLGKVKGKAK